MSDPLLAELVAQLERAHAAATEIAARVPTGVRAVEPSPGGRWYLCAFDGPAFLCIDSEMRAVTAASTVVRVATCALLVEHAESLIDPDELALLEGVADRVSRVATDERLAEVLRDIARRASALSGWRTDPARSVAAVEEIDRGVAAHDGLRRHYERFLDLTEPLVALQDTLDANLVSGLRDLDEAAGKVGLTGPLANDVGAAIEAVDAGAAEMIAAHLTPLD